MTDKSQLEDYISDAFEQLTRQVPGPEWLQHPLLESFIDAGFSLLGYYQNTDDIIVNENTIGAFVDIAMQLHVLAGDDSQPDAVRQRASELAGVMEDLVAAITRAVEDNIANKR